MRPGLGAATSHLAIGLGTRMQGGTHASHATSWCVLHGVTFVPWPPRAGLTLLGGGVGGGGAAGRGKCSSLARFVLFNLYSSKHTADSFEIPSQGQKWGEGLWLLKSERGQAAGD